MKRFNWRGFVSIFLLLDFVVLVVSGLILAVAPSGRVARQIDFQVLGVDKEGWEAIHTIFGYAMIVAIVFHLVYNWSIFKIYFRKVVGKVRKIRVLEAIIAVIVVVFLFAGTLKDVPPMSLALDLAEKVKDTYQNRSFVILDDGEKNEIEHDEEAHSNLRGGWMTLSQLCESLKVPIEVAISRLKEHGVEVDEDITIREIMDEKGWTFSEIEDIILYGKIED